MKKTATANQIIDLLQWTTDQYEQRLFKTIWNWCAHYGQYPSVTQQLMANAKVNRWFLCEYHKLEQQFLTLANHIPNNNLLQLEAHYKACTADIMGKYPKPLLEECKRNRNFSDLIITNTPVYYAN